MFFSSPTHLLSTNVQFFFNSDEDYSLHRVSNEDYKDVLIFIRNMRWLPNPDSNGLVTIKDGTLTIEGQYNTFEHGYKKFKVKYIVGSFGQCLMSEIEGGV